MSEKLIPFDFEEFKKDPSRLRHIHGDAPVWADVVRENVVTHWPKQERVLVYMPRDFSCLRLAAKTRKVMVRMFDYGCGKAGSVSSDISSIAGPTASGGQRWVSDPVEVEVQE